MVSLLIVVPTLNSFHLLPHLLSSLQDQTWPHWRLVFIDGPSNSEHQRWLDRCCSADYRCSWQKQDHDCLSIFGAMNQGFALAGPEDWLLFWGSDDWAAAPNALEAVISAIDAANCRPDLLICQGRYFNTATATLGRTSRFQPAGLLNSASYRRALLLGSSPPHQATLIGPGARSQLACYAHGFRLSADLDYFLQLSRKPYLCVQCLDLELVHMADGGVSGQQTQRRLQEVCRAYWRLFYWLCWFPFLARYVRRLMSILPSKRC